LLIDGAGKTPPMVLISILGSPPLLDR